MLMHEVPLEREGEPAKEPPMITMPTQPRSRKQIVKKTAFRILEVASYASFLFSVITAFALVVMFFTDFRANWDLQAQHRSDAIELYQKQYGGQCERHYDSELYTCNACRLAIGQWSSLRAFSITVFKWWTDMRDRIQHSPIFYVLLKLVDITGSSFGWTMLYLLGIMFMLWWILRDMRKDQMFNGFASAAFNQTTSSHSNIEIDQDDEMLDSPRRLHTLPGNITRHYYSTQGVRQRPSNMA